VVNWPGVPGKRKKPARKPNPRSTRGGRRRKPAKPAASRARVEAALRESEERLERVLEGSLDGYWDTDLVTGQSHVSTRWNEIFGRDPSRRTITQEEWAALVAPEDRAAIAPRILDVVGGRAEQLDVEYRIAHADGSERWARSRGRVVTRDGAGKPVRFAGTITDVTREKLAKRQFQRERDLLQRAFATPLVGIIILGPGGERVYVNDCAVARTGYTREEYLALPLAQFALPEDFHADLEALRRMVAGEVDHESRVRRFVRKDGTTYWASTSVHCARAADGSVTHLYYFVTDLSDLKATEAALKESEQRFRTVVESSLEGITVLDLGSRRYSFVSPAQSSMTGFPVAELLAMGAAEVLERVHPEDRSIPADQLAAIESGRSEGSNVEYRWKVRSGEYRWFSDSRKAIRDAEGRVVAVVGVAFDVTDRRRAEDSLRESERWLRMSQEIARIGHYLFDVQANHWTSSTTLNAIFGIDESFPRGSEDWLRIVHPDDRAAMGAYLADLLARGSRFDREYRVVDQGSGETRWVHGIGDLRRGPGGEPVRLVGTIQDITVRKQAESERTALQGKLALASRLAAMGTLVAGVAHEINNPLAGDMAGQGVALEIVREVRERLRGNGPLSREEEVRALAHVLEALEDAQECGLRIATIVKELSIFGRSDSQRERVRLVDVVEGARRWLPAAVARNVAIVVEDGRAPDVNAARGQLEQVVLNLLSNAARAVADGPQSPIVVRTGPGSPGMARLEVVDHGSGIDPAILDRIFEPFFTTRPTGAERGSGLGLAISQAIMTAHEGTLTAESEVGRGSTFRVELPVASAGEGGR